MVNQPEQPAQRAGFLDLPLELRYDVYDYILDSTTSVHGKLTGISILFRRDVRFALRPQIQKINPAIITLLSLNHQIRTEALPLVWKRNKVFLHYEYDPEYEPRGLLKSFDALAAAHITRVILLASVWAKPEQKLHKALCELAVLPALQSVQIVTAGQFLHGLYDTWVYPVHFVMGERQPCRRDAPVIHNSKNIYKFLSGVNRGYYHGFATVRLIWTMHVRGQTPGAMSNETEQAKDVDEQEENANVIDSTIDMTRLLRCSQVSCRMAYVMHRYGTTLLQESNPLGDVGDVEVYMKPLDLSDLFMAAETVVWPEAGLFGCLFPPPVGSEEIEKRVAVSLEIPLMSPTKYSQACWLRRWAQKLNCGGAGK